MWIFFWGKSAKFSGPGVFGTTVTQPASFRGYLLEQLTPLMREYGAIAQVEDEQRQVVPVHVGELGLGLVRGPRRVLPVFL